MKILHFSEKIYPSANQALNEEFENYSRAMTYIKQLNNVASRKPKYKQIESVLDYIIFANQQFEKGLGVMVLIEYIHILILSVYENTN